MTKIIDYYNCPYCKLKPEIDNQKRGTWVCILMGGSEKAECKAKCTIRDAGSCIIAHRAMNEIKKEVDNGKVPNTDTGDNSERKD